MLFVIESCRHCAACNTVTPHSRRWFSLPLGAAFVLAVIGGGMIYASWPPAFGAWVFLYLALLVYCFNRECMWRIRCERCRGKAVAELEKTKPDLKNTEINVM